MIRWAFQFAGVDIAPDLFARLLDRGGCVNVINPPAEVAVNAVWNAEIKERVVSWARGLSAEAVCPPPVDDSFESFEFIGMMPNLPQFLFGFVDIVGSRGDVDISQPDHRVIRGADFTAELFKAIKPG